tara:strand:- start:234 stop:1376 length:1143 start_codon:yes stop_codon:yes gene_type:complete
MSLIKVKQSSVDGGVGDALRVNAKPIIINGDMAVAQRSANATGLTSSGYKSLDRFYTTLYYSSSNVGTFTQSQSSDVPTGYGFRNSLKMDCTTAQTSLPASGQIVIRYIVEAQDLNPFKFGTSSAEKMTLSFWVKSNLTGTYNTSLYNADGGSTPQVNSQYSISSANTWEKKVLVFPADTTNGFNDDNGPGLYIDWVLGTGSDWTGGTAPTTWSSFVNNTFNGGSTINMASSTSNEWLITGIQLEVGEYTSSNIPPFEHESFGENLARCSRYYQMIADGSDVTNSVIGTGYFHTSSAFFFTVPIETMRSTPSLDVVMGTNYINITRNNGEDNGDNIETYSGITKKVLNLKADDNTSGTQGQGGVIQLNNSAARLAASSEL